MFVVCYLDLRVIELIPVHCCCSHAHRAGCLLLGLVSPLSRYPFIVVPHTRAEQVGCYLDLRAVELTFIVAHTRRARCLLSLGLVFHRAGYFLVCVFGFSSFFNIFLPSEPCVCGIGAYWKLFFLRPGPTFSLFLVRVGLKF